MIESPVAARVSSSTTTRTAPAAALVAAAGFVAEGVISLVHHTGDDHWDALSQVLNIAYTIASIALIAVLPTLGRWLGVGRAGRVGVIAAQIGFGAMAVESIVSGIHGGNILGGLFFGGLLLALIGQLVVGISALKAGFVRWAALLPFLGLIVGIAGGDHGGSIVLAGVWAILGVALNRRS